ncbi:MAG: S16 family serine protease [Actinomycetota bacterium]
MRRPAHPGRSVALIVVAVGAVLAVWLPIPYYAEGPGPARDVLPRIQYPGPTEGAARYDPTGSLELTTVRYRQLTPVLAVAAWIDDTQAIVPAEVVYPTDIPVQVVVQRGVSQMDQSKIAATAVALRAVGRYPNGHGPGALIEGTAEQCPADGKLFPGDIIVSVDGTRVRSAAQASRLFDRIPDDHALHFTLDVDGRAQEATFTRASCGPDNQPLVGISMIDAFPFTVAMTSDDIGGPSAGLMWALGLYELLTPQDLTAGRTIAGTGEIAPDGTVYPIGGIADKVVAAERAGATIFLTPTKNMPDLVGVNTGDMQVIPVATFDDAVQALRQGVVTP